MNETQRIILRRKSVLARTGLTKSTLYYYEIAGTFPKRVTLGKNSVGWYEDEVDDWIRSRPRVDVAAGPRCVPKVTAQSTRAA